MLLNLLLAFLLVSIKISFATGDFIKVDKKEGEITNIPILGSKDGNKKVGKYPKKGVLYIESMPPPVLWDAVSFKGYDSLIYKAGNKYGLDPELLRQVIWAESGFNPKAVSPKGAMGLMQLMPETANYLGVTDPFDPAQNIEGGARYLREMFDKFQGSVHLALAAYNAGPKRVLWYGDVPPIAETKGYVKKIVKRYENTWLKKDSGSLPETVLASTGERIGSFKKDSLSSSFQSFEVDSSKIHPQVIPPSKIYLISDGKGNIILTNRPLSIGK